MYITDIRFKVASILYGYTLERNKAAAISCLQNFIDHCQSIKRLLMTSTKMHCVTMFTHTKQPRKKLCVEKRETLIHVHGLFTTK